MNGEVPEGSRRDVEGDVPAVILQRRQGKARLAHELHPPVERVAGVSHSENGSGGHSGEIKFYLVDVAPTPVLSRLERLDDRVMG